MQWTREQYLDLMTFGESDRPMFAELFGPLVGLEQEWLSQGAFSSEIDLTAFEWDFVNITQCGGVTGLFGGFKPVVLEETKEYRIERDSLGRTMKLIKKTATIPLPLDYPVRDMDSWLQIKHFFTFREDRIDWNEVEKAKQLQRQGYLVTGSIPGGFDFPRQLMGEENTCLCYYDQPELMKDILETCTETALKVFERITESLVIDQLSVHEDMAGKSGPLIGSNQILEFIKPYYSTVWDLLSSRGTKIFSQDSDGNMNAVINAFIECGLTEMYPMEPAAGMDIVTLRKKYGKKLAFRGGIDKHVLRTTKEQIRKELEYKMQPFMIKSGGVVFGLDHRIPNGTPLENYRYYVDTAREILGLLPRSGKHVGWQRMAF